MTEDSESVARRYRAVEEKVRRAAEQAGRAPDAVRVLAVSKRKSAEAVRAAYGVGARLFGENYVQEALQKVDELPLDADWHMIGHLQSNKARRAAEIFSMVQTVDRPSVAQALEKALAAREATLPVLLQVNVGDEDSKAGATIEGATALARRAPEWPHLHVRGLMAIPPYREDAEAVRPYFRTVRELAERIAALELPGVVMDELSMGMSHDFPVAVQEGATMVRIGTAIFGERTP